MSSAATPEPPRRRRPLRGLLRSLALLLLIALLAAGAAAYWGCQKFESPGPLAEETTLVIPRGAGVTRIAETLAQAGVIEHDWLFLLGVKLLGQDQRLKAGEYAFPAGVSMRGAMEILVAGVTVVRRVTIPEGLTAWQIVQLLNAVPDLEGEPLVELPEEGSLLPETYFFQRGDTRADILARMRAAHDRAVRELWEDRQDGLPISTVEEWIILASIVEKETGLTSERPLVASVFINRLNIGMRLQSDPTVIYGITSGQGPLGRSLTRRDLDTPTPYNTYTQAGLPPGPIANPGLASLMAVLHPADTKYLYFVADGTGGHAFAETLDEHNRNVRRWREIERQRRNQTQ